MIVPLFKRNCYWFLNLFIYLFSFPQNKKSCKAFTFSLCLVDVLQRFQPYPGHKTMMVIISNPDRTSGIQLFLYVCVVLVSGIGQYPKPRLRMVLGLKKWDWCIPSNLQWQSSSTVSHSSAWRFSIFHSHCSHGTCFQAAVFRQKALISPLSVVCLATKNRQSKLATSWWTARQILTEELIGNNTKHQGE